MATFPKIKQVITFGFIFCVVFLACKPERNSPLTLTEILNVDSSNKKVQLNEAGFIEYLMDTITSYQFGNRYQFFQNGTLKMYSFHVDS